MTAVGFEHEALVYADDAEYVAALTPFVEQGLARGDAVMAIVPGARATALRDALGRDAGAVDFRDAQTWYDHPARTIAQYDEVLASLDGRRASVIGEVQFGGSPELWPRWTRYEAVLNRALARHRARVVCPYDVRVLPAEVVAHARHTHPHVLDGATRVASDAYCDPEVFVADLRLAPAVPSRPPDLHVAVRRPREARTAVARLARESAVDPGRADDLLLAVNEVVTNAIVHGGGRADLRGWTVGTGAVTLVIDDDGPGLRDPLAGFTPPDIERTGGRGLWMVRQLVDHVEVVPLDGRGTRLLLICC